MTKMHWQFGKMERFYYGIKPSWGDLGVIIHEMIHQLQCNNSSSDDLDAAYMRNIEFEAYLIMDICITESCLKMGALPDSEFNHFAEKFEAYKSATYSPYGNPYLILCLWPIWY